MGRGKRSPSWLEQTSTLNDDEQSRLYTNLAESLQAVRSACTSAFENDESATVVRYLDTAMQCLANVRQALTLPRIGDVPVTLNDLVHADRAAH